jgi:hypothetical protein
MSRREARDVGVKEKTGRRKDMCDMGTGQSKDVGKVWRECSGVGPHGYLARNGSLKMVLHAPVPTNGSLTASSGLLLTDLPAPFPPMWVLPPPGLVPPTGPHNGGPVPLGDPLLSSCLHLYPHSNPDYPPLPQVPTTRPVYYLSSLPCHLCLSRVNRLSPLASMCSP